MQTRNLITKRGETTLEPKQMLASFNVSNAKQFSEAMDSIRNNNEANTINVTNNFSIKSRLEASTNNKALTIQGTKLANGNLPTITNSNPGQNNTLLRINSDNVTVQGLGFKTTAGNAGKFLITTTGQTNTTIKNNSFSGGTGYLNFGRNPRNLNISGNYMRDMYDGINILRDTGRDPANGTERLNGGQLKINNNNVVAKHIAISVDNGNDGVARTRNGKQVSRYRASDTIGSPESINPTTYKNGSGISNNDVQGGLFGIAVSRGKNLDIGKNRVNVPRNERYAGGIHLENRATDVRVTNNKVTLNGGNVAGIQNETFFDHGARQANDRQHADGNRNVAIRKNEVTGKGINYRANGVENARVTDNKFNADRGFTGYNAPGGKNTYAENSGNSSTNKTTQNQLGKNGEVPVAPNGNTPT